MKILLIILMTLSLQGCMSKAKVGDCFLYDNTLYKVIEIGDNSLKLRRWNGAITLMEGTVIPYKVDCFDFFDKYKK